MSLSMTKNSFKPPVSIDGGCGGSIVKIFGLGLSSPPTRVLLCTTWRRTRRRRGEGQFQSAVCPDQILDGTLDSDSKHIPMKRIVKASKLMVFIPSNLTGRAVSSRSRWGLLSPPPSPFPPSSSGDWDVKNWMEQSPSPRHNLAPNCSFSDH